MALGLREAQRKIEHPPTIHADASLEVPAMTYQSTETSIDHAEEGKHILLLLDGNASRGYHGSEATALALRSKTAALAMLRCCDLCGCPSPFRLGYTLGGRSRRDVHLAAAWPAGCSDLCFRVFCLDL